MKKEVPVWVVVSSIVLVVLVGGFFIFRAMAGPADLPAPKIKVKQAIPDHLKGKLTPEQEAQILEQTKKYGEIDPNAAGSSPAPTAPPSGN